MGARMTVFALLVTLCGVAQAQDVAVGSLEAKDELDSAPGVITRMEGVVHGVDRPLLPDKTCSPGYHVHDFFFCKECNNGGPNYDCGPGSYQSGTSCDGHGSSDTQTCATCDACPTNE